jgi:hypothetical protein
VDVQVEVLFLHEIVVASVKALGSSRVFWDGYYQAFV